MRTFMSLDELLMCVIFARIRIGASEQASRLMTGISYVALAAVLSQGYWATWRFFRSIGEYETAEWFIVNGTLETWTLALISVGYSYHVSHVLLPVLGKYWLPIVMGSAGVIFVTFSNLPKFFS